MVEITLSQLTENKVDGAGVFDSLMRAAKDHLDLEYRKGTIKGPEYSTVYLGQLEAILSTSTQFLLQKDKVNLEARILEVQLEIVAVELLKANATLELVRQQAINAELEGKVLIAQECKLRAEYDLTLQTTIKSAAETTLLAQKTETEKAQVLGLGVDEDSVIGKQKKLYAAQTDGFKRDAEQKAAKLYVDVWSAQRMTDDGKQANPSNGLDDVTMGGVMAKLRQGVGIVV